MKKFYFGKGSKDGGMPFWKPWGFWGYMARFAACLLLTLAVLYLLSLFKPMGVRIGQADPNWNRPIVGGEQVGLPSPKDNSLPPFDQLEPAPNPDNGGATEIYPGMLYVIFDSDTDDQTFITFAENFTSRYPEPEHKISYYNTGSKTAILSVPEDNRLDICNRLPSEISEVEFLVVPVEVMTQYDAVIPDDPAFNDRVKSWYFQPIQMPEAWAITQGSSEITVGIVDSYMDLNHPELQGDRCVYPYSIVNGDTNVAPREGAPEAYYGHGTLVTAIAVGNANNGQGSSGIAPKCKFIPVSLGEELNTVTIVEGLLYCMYHGADVINLSCGAGFSEEVLSWPVEKQIRFSEEVGVETAKMWDYVFNLAEKRNSTIVWAAGNDNCFTAMDVSKRNENTIRVSAVDTGLRKASFSNFGNFSEYGINESTISAPGVAIWGALPNNSYDAWPGTSFSAPIITGVVALLKSENKDLTTNQIINIMQSTGVPVSGAPEIGKLVQVKDALLKARTTVASARTDNN